MFLSRRIFFHHDEASGRSIAINASSGAVDLLPSRLAHDLEARRGAEIPADLLSTLGGQAKLLEERGYLFADARQEEAKLREMQERVRAFAPLLTKFVLCPTYTCNLRCTYCYEGELTRRHGVMSVEQMRQAMSAIDVIRQRKGIERCIYELFGGEPLLPKTLSVVTAFFPELEARGSTVAIVTNGTHIDDFFPLLTEHRRAVESLQITLDGPQVVHDRRRIFPNRSGSFDRIVRGIGRLLDAGFFVRLRVNVDRENLTALPDLFDFVERHDWVHYQNFTCGVSPVTYHTQFVTNENVMREDEIVRTILAGMPGLLNPNSGYGLGMFRVLNHVTSVLEPRRSGINVLPTYTYCEATEGSVYVFGADGAIYPCPDAIVSPKWAIGRYTPEFQLDEERAECWRKDIFSTPECNECDIATFCGGGCALVPLDRGDPHPDCNGARETLHAYLKLWFERDAMNRRSNVEATQQGA